MKKNTFISILSLIFTLFLLVLTTLGWYVVNEEAEAKGITGNTSGDSYTLELEKGIYNGTSFSWTPTSKLTFKDISPGNKFFFRIKIAIDGDEAQSFSASFKGVESELMADFTLSNNKLMLDNVPLYDVTTNNEVVIEEGKVLYTYDNTNEVFNLVDYKIENTFMFYNLGSTLITTDSLDGKTGTKLTEVTDYDFTTAAGAKEVYQYFAIEFNEAATLVNINGIECSNAYLYQRLIIDHIEIKKNN